MILFLIGIITGFITSVIANIYFIKYYSSKNLIKYLKSNIEQKLVLYTCDKDLNDRFSHHIISELPVVKSNLNEIYNICLDIDRDYFKLTGKQSDFCLKIMKNISIMNSEIFIIDAFIDTYAIELNVDRIKIELQLHFSEIINGMKYFFYNNDTQLKYEQFTKDVFQNYKNLSSYNLLK